MIVVLSVIGILLFGLIGVLERVLLPWYPRGPARRARGDGRGGLMAGSVTTIVQGSWVLAMAPGEDAALRDAAVAIADDGAIADVGPAGRLLAAHPGAEVVGDGYGIVLPGFVNAHTHLTECLIPGMAEDASLWPWFERIINPVGMVIEREDMRIGTRLKAAEMLRSGITTVNDMSCHRNVGALASLGAADGLESMGMRGVLSFGAEDAYPGAPAAQAFLDEELALADRVAGRPLLSFPLRHRHGPRRHRRALRPDRARVRRARVRPSTPTCTRCERSSRRRWWPTASRPSSTPAAWACSTTTSSPATACGAAPTTSACWHPRTSPSPTNPVANMILGSGVAPVPALRAAGLRVGLGTDGAASNDNQDMFGVLKTTGLIHKLAALDPTRMTAREVLTMATIEGARALGLDREIGSLEPGKRADVVLLDGATPELATIHDPWQQVVYCATARCVSDVWVDGVARVRGGELLGHDLGELAREARDAAIDLVGRANLTESALLRRPTEAASA